ncbi:MAG: hypothetical protein M5U09_18145 [Gammaproteobacteria bacterium]|nr:hypothetical protein [Gammaproteobacteria bacterium]
MPDETTTWSPLRLVGERLITALGATAGWLALHAATGQRAWVSSLRPTLFAAGDGRRTGLRRDQGRQPGGARPGRGAATLGMAAREGHRTDHIRGIMWPPVVAGDRLLAASMDGHLYAFRGGEGWQRPAPAPASNAAAADGSRWGPVPDGLRRRAGALWAAPRRALRPQLADLQVLRRYDLVILAGSLDDDGIAKAVRQYVEGGGTGDRRLLGHQIADPQLADQGRTGEWMGDKSAAPGGVRHPRRSMTPSPQIDSGPFAGIPLAEGLVSEKVLGYVPDPSGLREVVTLARYPSTAKDTNPAGGPAANAVVAGRLGQGTVILCGLQAGVKTEHSGLTCRQLMLADRDATGGRATPQLVPDTKLCRLRCYRRRGRGRGRRPGRDAGRRPGRGVRPARQACRVTWRSSRPNRRGSTT